MSTPSQVNTFISQEKLIAFFQDSVCPASSTDLLLKQIHTLLPFEREFVVFCMDHQQQAKRWRFNLEVWLRGWLLQPFMIFGPTADPLKLSWLRQIFCKQTCQAFTPKSMAKGHGYALDSLDDDWDIRALDFAKKFTVKLEQLSELYTATCAHQWEILDPCMWMQTPFREALCIRFEECPMAHWCQIMIQKLSVATESEHARDWYHFIRQVKGMERSFDAKELRVKSLSMLPQPVGVRGAKDASEYKSDLMHANRWQNFPVILSDKSQCALACLKYPYCSQIEQTVISFISKVQESCCVWSELEVEGVWNQSDWEKKALVWFEQFELASALRASQTVLRGQESETAKRI